MASGTRLQFDKDLIGGIRTRRRRSASPLFAGVMILVLGVVGTALSLSACRMLWPSDKEQVRESVLAFAECLRTGDIEGALRACAEEERAPGTARRQSLSDLRARLEEDGIQWDQATPVAFGGARAGVKDPGRGAETVEAAVGYLYFLSGEDAYAIELSLRFTSESCLVAETWSTEKLPGASDVRALKAHADAKFESFKQEEEDPDDATEYSNVGRLFLTF